MKLQLKRNLWGLGLTGVFFLVVTGATALWCSSRIDKGLHKINMAADALRNHLECDMMHDAIRGDVLASFLEETRETAAKDLQEHVAWFDEKINENSKLPLPQNVKDEIAKVTPVLESYKQTAGEIIAKAVVDREAALTMLPAFDKVYGELEDSMEALSDVIDQAGADYIKAEADEFTFFRIVLGSVTLGLGSALLCVIAWQIRNITRPLNLAIGALVDESGQVSEAARKLSSVGSSFQEAAERQKEALVQTTHTLGELQEAGERTSQSIVHANDITGSARRLAIEGQEASQRMVEAIKEIAATSRETARVIETIDKIAAQTNLLSLNASVEAARAGEAGRGFAVVAGEVGNLAKQSAESAKSTGELMKRAMRAAEQGSAAAAEVEKSISNIAKSYEEVDAVVSGIRKEVETQKSAIATAESKVQQIEELVGQGMNIAAHASQSSSELSCASVNLDKAVVTARQMVSAGLVSGESEAANVRPSSHGQAAPMRLAA